MMKHNVLKMKWVLPPGQWRQAKQRQKSVREVKHFKESQSVGEVQRCSGGDIIILGTKLGIFTSFTVADTTQQHNAGNIEQRNRNISLNEYKQTKEAKGRYENAHPHTHAKMGHSTKSNQIMNHRAATVTHNTMKVHIGLRRRSGRRLPGVRVARQMKSSIIVRSNAFSTYIHIHYALYPDYEFHQQQQQIVCTAIIPPCTCRILAKYFEIPMNT